MASKQKQKHTKIRRRRCPICKELDYPKDMVYEDVYIQECHTITESGESVPLVEMKTRYVHKSCFEEQMGAMAGTEALEKLKEKSKEQQQSLDRF